ncbi:hypothetical protein [Streptosporangium sp. NPDC048865]|uniref:hypothetical protein n=1 Tax=Streptosporangium sp. NPDC048865 TaxID=3155766 RepID=UPI0034448C58
MPEAGGTGWVATGARDLVGAEAFASAYARGAAMRHDEVLATLDAEDAEDAEDADGDHDPDHG